MWSIEKDQIKMDFPGATFPGAEAGVIWTIHIIDRTDTLRKNLLHVQSP